MSFWSDMDSEMHPVSLDMETADRLLGGAVAPEDAPPGYAEVARLLEAVSAEPTSHELAREAEVVAKVASAVRYSSNTHSPRRSFMPVALSRPRITAALVAAALAACTVGLASASALPGAAQDIASEMLAKVGISVSGPNDNAGTHPDVRGKSAVTPSDAGKGSDISDLATTTELSGVEKGAAISSVASEGKSQAGTHGGGSGASAPVATPNSGGTGTADTASDGKSTAGTGTANTASGGHSSAGSANAGTGQATADEASGGHSSDGQAHRP
jgi:hypothetical protein